MGDRVAFIAKRADPHLQHSIGNVSLIEIGQLEQTRRQGNQCALDSQQEG